MNKSEVALRKAAACAESPPVAGPAAGATPAAVTANAGFGGTPLRSAASCSRDSDRSPPRPVARWFAGVTDGHANSNRNHRRTDGSGNSATPAMTTSSRSSTISASRIHVRYFATSSTHDGAEFCVMVSIDTMPSGGLGGGTTATSPELTRASSGVRVTGVVPRRRRGRVTRRNAPDNMRSGTRLARTVARMVRGLASSFACKRRRERHHRFRLRCHQLRAIDLLQRGARQLRLMQHLVGFDDAIHLLPGGCHQRRTLRLHNLRAHAAGAAIARIEIQVVHPSGGGAIHGLHGGVPAPVNRRRDDRIRRGGVEAGRRIIDERLHVRLKCVFCGSFQSVGWVRRLCSAPCNPSGGGPRLECRGTDG